MSRENDAAGTDDSPVRSDPPERPDGGLPRLFGPATTTYIVLASIIGTGIFTTSGYIVHDTGSHWSMLALWLVGGGLALCGALTVAELGAAMPHAGGEYVYMREAYGPLAGFLYGWVSFVIGFSAPTAASAQAAARYLVGAFAEPGGARAQTVSVGLAALIVVLFTWIHLRGAGPGSRAQNWTTLLKLAVLGAMIVGGFAFGRGTFEHLSAPAEGEPIRLGVMSASLVYVMFSYSGWNSPTYLAGEVRDAPRVLPRAILLGLAGVIVLYLLINLVYVYALSVEDVRSLSGAHVEAIAGVAAGRLLGPWVSRPLSAAIGIGILATVSAFVLTGPRIYYAMARDGLFPKLAGRLNADGVPAAAIVAQCVCTLLLLLSGSFQSIVYYAGVGLSLSSFFVILSVFVLRVRRPDMPRPFRTPGYPVVPAVFLLLTVWMIVFAVRGQPVWSLVSIGSIAAGVPVYWIWRKTQRT